MKKVIFMLAAGAISLAACTDTEVIDEGIQSGTIGFDSHVSKNSRAIATDNFKQFYVYGSYIPKTSSERVTVFNNIPVTYDENSKEWGYAEKRSWVPEAKYTFAAYAIEGEQYAGFRANYVDADGVLNLDGVLVDDTHQYDLVYATRGSDANPIVGKVKDNDVVAFNFTHILSRLNFHFISGFPAGYNVIVKNIRVNNVRNKGHFNGTPGAIGVWTLPDREPEDSNPVIRAGFKDNDNVVSASDTPGEDGKQVTTDWVYVLPCEYKAANIDIIFDIDVETTDGTPIIGANNITGTWQPVWEINKSYTYNITITGSAAGLEEIKFSGTVNEWTEGVPQNPNFNLGAGEVPHVEI